MVSNYNQREKGLENMHYHHNGLNDSVVATAPPHLGGFILLVFNNYIILLKRPYYAYRSGVN